MRFTRNDTANMNLKGFTLIEMLVAVAIIVIVVATVLLVINPEGARKKARDARRINDITSMKTALELYLSDNKKYPYGNGALGCGSGTSPYWQRVDRQISDTTCLYSGLVTGNYMGSFPVDPSKGPSGANPSSACDVLNTVPYRYNYWSDGNAYILTAILESSNGNTGHACDALPNWLDTAKYPTADCGTALLNCYGIQNP